MPIFLYVCLCNILPYFELHLPTSKACLTFSICTSFKLYPQRQSTHSPFKGFKSIILSFIYTYVHISYNLDYGVGFLVVYMHGLIWLTHRHILEPSLFLCTLLPYVVAFTVLYTTICRLYACYQRQIDTTHIMGDGDYWNIV